jgi:hypothetical protein
MDRSPIPRAIGVTWYENTEENHVILVRTATFLVYILTVYRPIGRLEIYSFSKLVTSSYSRSMHPAARVIKPQDKTLVRNN